MAFISVNLSDEEKASIKKDANKEGLTVSAYIKKLYANKSKCTYDPHERLIVVHEMSTNLNRLKIADDDSSRQKYIKSIEGGLKRLWQI